MKKILILFILSFSAGTCIGDEGVTESTIEPAKHSRAPHAIPSEKLRAIMLKINSSLQASKHTDIQNNPIDEDQMAALNKAVGDLLLTTEAMANQPPDTKFEEYKQIGFKASAINLNAETKNLKNVVDANQYELIDSAYLRLSETCKACHDTFR